MTFHFLGFFHRTNLFFCCGPISRQLVLLAPKRWVTSIREDAEVIEVEGRWDCPLHTQIFQPWRWTFEYSIEVDAYSRLGGGGDTPLYKPYRYVPPHRVGVLRRFGLKTGIDFADFVLESGMVVEGTTEVYERIYSKWVRKREKYVNSKWILSNIFCCCSK